MSGLLANLSAIVSFPLFSFTEDCPPPHADHFICLRWRFSMFIFSNLSPCTRWWSDRDTNRVARAQSHTQWVIWFSLIIALVYYHLWRIKSFPASTLDHSALLISGTRSGSESMLQMKLQTLAKMSKHSLVINFNEYDLCKEPLIFNSILSPAFRVCWGYTDLYFVKFNLDSSFLGVCHVNVLPISEAKPSRKVSQPPP